MTRELANVDRIIAISSFIRRRLLEAGHSAEKVVYIPNGVPGLERRPSTPPSHAKNVLFVGRIVHNKGLRELVAAFRNLRDPEATLSVVGDGHDLPAIRGETRDDGRIRYLGWLPPEQVAEAYRASRLVVVPSLWHEVMNTVICEAQSWSRPVVATRVGGNGDLVRNGDDGFLCPPGDAEALRAAMERLLWDDDLCRRMSRRAFAKVQQYGLERHLDSLEALYSEFLSQR